MSLFRKVSDTLVLNPLSQMWSPTRPLTLCKSTLKCVGRSVTLGVGLCVVGVALKALALTPVGPALGTVSFLATLGSFSPALLLTSAAVATLSAGILISYLIERHAV